MNGLTLEIFSHSKDTRQLKNVGMEYKYEDCEVNAITFYSINAISKEKEGNKVYTCIFANGEQFICPLNPYRVMALISDAYATGNLK